MSIDIVDLNKRVEVLVETGKLSSDDVYDLEGTLYAAQVYLSQVSDKLKELERLTSE